MASDSSSFMTNYGLLKQMGEVPATSVPSVTSSSNLGWWCSNQRAYGRTGLLSLDRIELLDALPFWTWRVDEEWKTWMINYDMVKQVWEIPEFSFELHGVRIGIWCRNQQTFKRNGTLPQARIDLLDALPFWKW